MGIRDYLSSKFGGGNNKIKASNGNLLNPQQLTLKTTISDCRNLVSETLTILNKYQSSMQILQFVKGSEIQDITPEQIKEYMEYMNICNAFINNYDTYLSESILENTSGENYNKKLSQMNFNLLDRIKKLETIKTEVSETLEQKQKAYKKQQSDLNQAVKMLDKSYVSSQSESKSQKKVISVPQDTIDIPIIGHQLTKEETIEGNELKKYIKSTYNDLDKEI